VLKDLLHGPRFSEGIKEGMSSAFDRKTFSGLFMKKAIRVFTWFIGLGKSLRTKLHPFFGHPSCLEGRVRGRKRAIPFFTFGCNCGDERKFGWHIRLFSDSA